MNTFLSFIGIIALFFIGKFIYDTYLTNNTEKDWEEYKKNHPNEAIVVETNKGLDLSTRAKIRTDGYYVNRYDGTNYRGEKGKFTLYLIFNDLGYAYYEDMQGHPEFSNEILKKSIESMSVITKEDLNDNIGRYNINNNGKLDIIFYDPNNYDNKGLEEEEEPLNFKRLQGSIIKNGLILTIKNKNYSEYYEKIHEYIVLSDIKFEFIKVNFN